MKTEAIMYEVETIQRYYDTAVNYTRQVGERISYLREESVAKMLEKNLVKPLRASTMSEEKGQKKVFMCFRGMQKVGGIEVATHSLVQKFPGRITILTNAMDPVWFIRLSRYANVIVDAKCSGQYEADVVILAQQDCAKWLDNFKNIKQTKVYQQIHADLSYYDGIEVNLHRDYENDDRIDNFLTVSPNAQKALKDVLGLDSVMLPNVKRPKRDHNLTIGFFSRATPEKNPEGIAQFANIAASMGYKANYFISSDMDSALVRKDVLKRELEQKHGAIYVPINEQSMDWLPKMDYLIQLSHGEASCEVVREALDNKVPVIVSRIPAFEYIKDGVHGWHVSNIPTKEEIENIFTKVPKITKKVWDEKTDVKTWEKVLGGEL